MIALGSAAPTLVEQALQHTPDILHGVSELLSKIFKAKPSPEALTTAGMQICSACLEVSASFLAENSQVAALSMHRASIELSVLHRFALEPDSEKRLESIISTLAASYAVLEACTEVLVDGFMALAPGGEEGAYKVLEESAEMCLQLAEVLVSRNLLKQGESTLVPAIQVLPGALRFLGRFLAEAPEALDAKKRLPGLMMQLLKPNSVVPPLAIQFLIPALVQVRLKITVVVFF